MTTGIILVYYASGHGLGHATRVSALASALLSLDSSRPTVHIVSSAPKHAFADCIAAGALYRYAVIDPVIVQPLAYRVDRLKSVSILESFLQEKDKKIEEEVRWLKLIRADCVLSDSVFLGCLSAKAASIPSALVTNFTFDSVYSYLSTSLVDEIPQLLHPDVSNSSLTQFVLPCDAPISRERLSPLVNQIHAGFRCADLLCLLPGGIPIPSFSVEPELPSPDWIDLNCNAFRPEIAAHLLQDPSTYKLHPSISFPSRIPVPKRTVISAPLLVRSSNPGIFTPAGRSRFLSSLGIPVDKHDAARTPILVVSFGGQIFHTPSRSLSPAKTARVTPISSNTNLADLTKSSSVATCTSPPLANALLDPTALTAALHLSQNGAKSPIIVDTVTSPRITTESHLWIPGGPPAAKLESPYQNSRSTFITSPSTPHLISAPGQWTDPRLLPDESWIAIVCGAAQSGEEEEDLPEGFYIAPRDIWMPDLTAVADVLLGKLGYGGVSECLDSCTPFVYVPRPLFIEEHGLRLLLEREGTGVELSRVSYEAGDWADAIQTAWERGRESKLCRRNNAEHSTRHLEIKRMAQKIVDWVNDWKQLVAN